MNTAQEEVAGGGGGGGGSSRLSPLQRMFKLLYPEGNAELPVGSSSSSSQAAMGGGGWLKPPARCF